MRIEWGKDLFEAEMCPKEGIKSDCERSDDQMLLLHFCKMISSRIDHLYPFPSYARKCGVSGVFSVNSTDLKKMRVVELFDHLHQGEKTLSKFLLNKNLKSPISMLIFHVDLFLQNA